VTRRAVLKVASQWLVAGLLAVTLAAFFFFLTAFQVSADGTAHRILRRGVAITTDIDAILPQITTDLHSAAQTSDQDPVRVPNFPVPVDIPKEEAVRIEGEELRQRLLDRSADRLYDDGMSAWAQSDTESNQNITRFSTAGGLHRAFGLVTQKWNSVYLGAAALFGFLSLILAAILWLNLKSYLRLLALGAATATAAVISLAAAVAVRFALRTAETEADPFEKELIDLGVDVVWLFIRNYLVLSLLGFAVLAVSAFFFWWESRTAEHPAVRPVEPTA
jgi:phosphate/sulfate permease